MEKEIKKRLRGWMFKWKWRGLMGFFGGKTGSNRSSLDKFMEKDKKWDL